MTLALIMRPATPLTDPPMAGAIVLEWPGAAVFVTTVVFVLRVFDVIVAPEVGKGVSKVCECDCLGREVLGFLEACALVASSSSAICTP